LRPLPLLPLLPLLPWCPRRGSGFGPLRGRSCGWRCFHCECAATACLPLRVPPAAAAPLLPGEGGWRAALAPWRLKMEHGCCPFCFAAALVSTKYGDGGRGFKLYALWNSFAPLLPSPAAAALGDEARAAVRARMAPPSDEPRRSTGQENCMRDPSPPRIVCAIAGSLDITAPRHCEKNCGCVMQRPLLRAVNVQPGFERR
jgi:hypothetical protein